jgi:3-hydroxy-3-methylglutaryl CoA synthase
MTEVGIDDLNVYGSTLCVEAVDIARARGKPESAVTAIGLLRRSLPPAFEDPVTLAVNAARPLDLAGVGLLIVATESGVDFAKPVSSYVHHWLGLPAACAHVEMKHACFAGTAGLRLAAAWVRERPERRALVIMTDMARRLFGDSAEPAEGAGAVALLVAARPRVLALDPWSGVAAREIYDVMRPTPTKETIHAALSLAAYLDLLEVAWAGYAEAAGPGAFARLERVVYHTPVPPLVEQAHALLVETNEPEIDADELPARFERQVAPSLRYTRELGNTYSACLYAALAGLVDSGFEGRAGLYSYGSGSCAEFGSGVVVAGAGDVLGIHRIGQALAARRTVDIATYERLVVEHERGLTEPDHVPDRDLVPGLYGDAYAGRGLLVLEAVREHYRVYTRT